MVAGLALHPVLNVADTLATLIYFAQTTLKKHCYSLFPQVDTLAFANFSHALMVPPKGGTGLMEVPVDYTKQPLSTDSAYRDQVRVL